MIFDMIWYDSILFICDMIWYFYDIYDFYIFMIYIFMINCILFSNLRKARGNTEMNSARRNEWKTRRWDFKKSNLNENIC